MNTVGTSGSAASEVTNPESGTHCVADAQPPSVEDPPAASGDEARRLSVEELEAEMDRASAARPIWKELEDTIGLQRDAMRKLARCIVRLSDLIAEEETGAPGGTSQLHRAARDVRQARFELETAQLALRDLLRREGSLQPCGRRFGEVSRKGSESDIAELRAKMMPGAEQAAV